MNASKNKPGFTFFELMITVAVLSILVSIVIGVGSFTLKQAKNRLAESTINILVTALEQYHDFTGTFPPQCDDINCVENELDGDFIGPGDYQNEFSSSEVLYYYLNRIPESRRIIGAISNSLITNLDEREGMPEDQRRIEFNPNSGGLGNFYLSRFIDPWGTSLLYEYEKGDNFPRITSAGPDGDFGKSDDNITSTGI